MPYESSGDQSRLKEKGLDRCVYVELRPETTRRSSTYANLIDAYADISRRTLAKGCGNCGEMAAAAFTLAFERGCSAVDYAVFNEIDHALCVVGRPDGTDLDRPGSWGPGCWFVDPWLGGITGKDDWGVFNSSLFDIVMKRAFDRDRLTVESKSRWPELPSPSRVGLR